MITCFESSIVDTGILKAPCGGLLTRRVSLVLLHGILHDPTDSCKA